MITRITMNKVNSYKNPAIIETDKKVNLIYGLNGTGKSTLSDFLYSQTASHFKECNIEGLGSEEIIVYNQQFIKDYFYESENLKGIFTLSKANTEAEKKIRIAEKEIDKLEKQSDRKSGEILKHQNDLNKKKQDAENKIWEIKTTYSGGDRVLEYCLSALMGRKESLFNHLIGMKKPDIQPTKPPEILKKEVEAIQGSNAKKSDLLPEMNFTGNHNESDALLNKIIIGNNSSIVAGLIKKLGNSDWVKEGLEYISEEINEDGEACPFCQEKTITKALIENIRNYFDKTYENDINDLKALFSNYVSSINSLPHKEIYETHSFIVNKRQEFENLYSSVFNIFNNNKNKISKKLKLPSNEVTLESSFEAISTFNNFIKDINDEIRVHNSKIDNKDKFLDDIKKQFWNYMRWYYDQTISTYQKFKTDVEKIIKNLKDEVIEINREIDIQKGSIVEEQKKTVSIEEAITNINNGLLGLGIDDFRIEKHSDALYKIVRTEQCDDTFLTLSEGEKMIISFLYFREHCKGKKEATSQALKKIVVIDDPISSMSHVYIFAVGQLIKNEFFNSPSYEQIFLLTHSLYFFYEMTDANHERRKEKQKLFRMYKNGDGSHIVEMKYEEIQNDYHSYWYIVKDDKQPPALIANCMRNIIEYFFSFIENKNLSNVFQTPQLQDVKYQAFCRYINRESHSLGQNIFDIKEFNYSDFKEAFQLVFTECGYKDHYDKMIK